MSSLPFHNDAIMLSGELGSRLKCSILSQYYPLWWRITSGGKSQSHSIPTAIIEMNAATGEIFNEETRKTILGSAGHALNLKMKNPNAWNLKILLIEENIDCFFHLKNVIRKRWSSFEPKIKYAEGPIDNNYTNIYLLNKKLEEALDIIEDIELGMSLFFFDPLLCTQWTNIERVAKQQVTTFLKTGTEFILFVFTSDWFQGREKPFKMAPLPNSSKEDEWTPDERETVYKADSFFGNKEWRTKILCDKPIKQKEQELRNIYRNRLLKWFRYILPLPFKPKPHQLYHLFVCSNYEAGIHATKRDYAKKTNNKPYSPNKNVALENFEKNHALSVDSIEWWFLWRIIYYHERGICDKKCSDFSKRYDDNIIQTAIDWLIRNNYLKRLYINESAWIQNWTRYKLNWDVVEKKLKIRRPAELTPLSERSTLLPYFSK